MQRCFILISSIMLIISSIFVIALCILNALLNGPAVYVFSMFCCINWFSLHRNEQFHRFKQELLQQVYHFSVLAVSCIIVMRAVHERKQQHRDREREETHQNYVTVVISLTV